MTGSKIRLAAALLFALFAVATTIYIFDNSSKDASASSKQSTVIVDKVETVADSMGITTERTALEIFVRKSAHFAEFFFLGLTLSFAFCFLMPKKRFLLCFPAVYAASAAFIDEFAIQANTAGRSAELTDVLIDVSGAFLSIAVVYCIWFICVKFKKKRETV